MRTTRRYVAFIAAEGLMLVKTTKSPLSLLKVVRRSCPGAQVAALIHGGREEGEGLATLLAGARATDQRSGLPWPTLWFDALAVRLWLHGHQHLLLPQG